MALLDLFEIGRSAIMASQSAINTTSHNIANINTEGYNRQEVILSIATPNQVGNNYLGRGVLVRSVRSCYDRFLEAQLLRQEQVAGRSSALEQSFGRIEQVFNEPQGIGIAGYIIDYFNAWNEVVISPESQPSRSLLLEKADALVRVAVQTEQEIKNGLDYINASIDETVVSINAIATDIARLNRSIEEAEGGGDAGVANDLRNSRDILLGQLAELTEFSTYTTDRGAVNVTVGMRNLVYGEKTYAMTAVLNSEGGRDIFLDNTEVADNITNGQLGGLLAARGSIESGPLESLRMLVASVVMEVNILHNQGYGLDGSTGNDFFSPLQLATEYSSAGADISASIADMTALTLHEYTISFDPTATNYSVIDSQTGATVASGVYVSGAPVAFDGISVTITGTISASDTFTVSPLTDAIKNFGVAITDPNTVAASSTPEGLPGNSINALGIFALADSPVTGLGGMTFSEYYQGIVSSVGAMSSFASASLKFENAILEEIRNRRESVSGVSLDEEASNLIQFQRAFEAGARMIRVVDELYQVLLNM